MSIPHIGADISDGKGFYTGTVSDISRFGLSISNIPKRLDKFAEMYSVILDGPGTHFKLLARPIWETEDGGSKNDRGPDREQSIDLDRIRHAPRTPARGRSAASKKLNRATHPDVW